MTRFALPSKNYCSCRMLRCKLHGNLQSRCSVLRPGRQGEWVQAIDSLSDVRFALLLLTEPAAEIEVYFADIHNSRTS